MSLLEYYEGLDRRGKEAFVAALRKDIAELRAERIETTVRASRSTLDKVLAAAKRTGFKLTAKGAVNTALLYLLDLIEGHDSNEVMCVETPRGMYRLPPEIRRNLHGIPRGQAPNMPKQAGELRTLQRWIVAKNVPGILIAHVLETEARKMEESEDAPAEATTEEGKA